MRYQRTQSPEDRFWKFVDKSGDCWIWTGAVTRAGYGLFSVLHAGTRKQQKSAHRYAYELAHGPVSPGQHVDHLCHNKDVSCCIGPACPHRRCVRPDHLEAVTPSVNYARAFARRGAATHCKWGHPFTAENTVRRADGSRYCRTCRVERDHQRTQAELGKTFTLAEREFLIYVGLYALTCGLRLRNMPAL